MQVGPEAAAPVEVSGHPIQCQCCHPLTLDRGRESMCVEEIWLLRRLQKQISAISTNFSQYMASFQHFFPQMLAKCNDH